MNGLGRRDDRLEDREVRLHRLERHRHDEVGGVGQPRGTVDHERRLADRDPIRGDDRQTVLRREMDRFDGRAAKCLSPGHSHAVELGFTFAHGDERDRRHVHQVRRADRADLGHDRVDTAIEHRDVGLGDRRRGTRPAAGDAGKPDCHGRTDDLGLQRLSDATRVNANGHGLRLFEDLERDALVAHVSEAGVQTIDERLAADQAVHDGAGFADPFGGRWTERDMRAVCDRDDVRDRQGG